MSRPFAEVWKKCSPVTVKREESSYNQDQAHHEQETPGTPETRGEAFKPKNTNRQALFAVRDVTLSDGAVRDDGYFSSNQHIINKIECWLNGAATPGLFIAQLSHLTETKSQGLTA